MTDPDYLHLQLVVVLFRAPFANICITQPALRDEVGADPLRLSLSVSAAILGLAGARPAALHYRDRCRLDGHVRRLLRDPRRCARLNRKLSTGQGRANALYVPFYYGGGWLGITGSGLAYRAGGWQTVVYFTLSLALIPLAMGIGERSRG